MSRNRSFLRKDLTHFDLEIFEFRAVCSKKAQELDSEFPIFSDYGYDFLQRFVGEQNLNMIFRKRGEGVKGRLEFVPKILFGSVTVPMTRLLEMIID